MKLRCFIGIALLVGAWCLSGCRESEFPPEPYHDHDRPGLGSIQIVMPSDTLRFLPGDSVMVKGFIVVKDDAGRVVPGIKVSIELMEDFGSIEFEGNQDTTDAQGRVYIIFRTPSLTVAHSSTIHAWIGSKENRQTLWLQPMSQIASLLCAQFAQDTVYLPQDSVGLTVCLLDSNRVGIPGIMIVLRAGGGRLQPLPETGDDGCAHTIWYFNAPCRYCLPSCAGTGRDSACVTVIDTTGGRRVRRDRL